MLRIVHTLYGRMVADESGVTDEKGYNVIMFKGYVWFIRERNGAFWLVDDSKPELALKLPGVHCQREAERMAWVLVNG